MSFSLTGKLRGVMQAAIVVLLLLAALAFRVVISARAELAEADRLLASSDVDASILHYRRAARWYAPGSPYHVTALSRLAQLGAQAELRGETERALTAYRAMRSAIMAARSFYIPESARLHAANRKIAALMAQQPLPAVDAGKSRQQVRDEHLALLETNRDPKIWWTWVLLLGFFGWVAGAYIFTIRAIDEHDRLVPREALRWGAVIAVGFGLFVLGMALA